MKHCFLIVSALLCTAGPLLAESNSIVFDENFEDSSYEEGATIPDGPGLIHHGRWALVPAKHAYLPVVATVGEARCVELSIPPDGEDGKRARLIGSFGTDNLGTTVVQEGLHFQLSFQANQILGDDFYIQILGNDGKARASLTMNKEGKLLIAFGGEWEEVDGDFEADHWYRIEFKMPPRPETSSRYEFSLYDRDGESLLFQKRGRVARSVEAGGSGYIGFEIMHRTKGGMVLVDDIRAKTVEP